MKQGFWAVLRLGLGAVFVWAGAQKLLDPVAFAAAVSAYELLPGQWVTLVATLLPGIEALAGLAFLCGVLAEGAALLIGLLSLGFAAAVASALWRGLEIGCGCFGGGQVQGSHLVLNALMFAAAWGWLTWAASPQKHTPQ